MKILKKSSLFLLFTMLSQALLCQLKYVQHTDTLPPHPRILLLKGEERNIREYIEKSTLWRNVHEYIIQECDQIIELPTLKRELTGRRLLSVSREALRRIFYLSYAYRMENEEKYFERAESELEQICRFSDWNPTHFLDVAEMTMAVAIGYDWLFDQLTEEARKEIRHAIVSKGIDPSMNGKYSRFLTDSHNWNQVCNTGMVYGMLAVSEDFPEITKYIVDQAIHSIQLPMNEYAPDGAYPEGYAYWGYGTTYNVLLISALKKAYKNDFGLFDIPGFMKTASYFEHMVSPTRIPFNYSDCRSQATFEPAMFWFAKELGDFSLLWNEKEYLSQNNSDYLKNYLLPAAMIWGDGVDLEEIVPPKELVWAGDGATPVTMMRTSWNDLLAIFVGTKGGRAFSNHAHMDAGSFVMDADGVRWAMDFGLQDYHSLEKEGIDLWNRKQNSERWNVFRYNNFAHNTLTINNELHRVNGKGDLLSYSDSPNFMHAIYDLTDVFEGQLASSQRGIAIVEKEYVLIQDEIRTLKDCITIRWNMLTPADVEVTPGNEIILRKQGKKLKLKVVQPDHVNMKIWSTESPNKFDSPNSGTTFVGFEVVVPAQSATTLSVLLLPDGEDRLLINESLDKWSKK